jgi:hypothetical protein
MSPRPLSVGYRVKTIDVARFDLPNAQSFSTSFCRSCGSPLPHATRSGREIIIPAGSLRTDPGVSPTVDSCWGSRARCFPMQSIYRPMHEPTRCEILELCNARGEGRESGYLENLTSVMPLVGHARELCTRPTRSRAAGRIGDGGASHIDGMQLQGDVPRTAVRSSSGALCRALARPSFDTSQ